MAHIVRFILAMVFMALHQPSMIVGIIIAASFWLSDRIYRAGRMVLHSRATMVKLKPLPGDAVKLVFTKPMGFKPGAHAFIYIPEISKLESHPFYFSSAPSSNSMEMLIRVNGDWTKELHRYVSERYSEDRLHRPLNQPELKVWVDGPYGGPPKLDTNNKTLLIADGAGASFLFSVAGQLSSRAQGGSHVRAVWFIRDEEHRTWFQEEIEESEGKGVNISVRVMSLEEVVVKVHAVSLEKEVLGDGQTGTAAVGDLERGAARGVEMVPFGASKQGSTEVERLEVEVADAVEIVPLSASKQDVAAITSNIIQSDQSPSPTQKIFVGVCGPPEIIKAARNVAAAGNKQLRIIDMYCASLDTSMFIVRHQREEAFLLIPLRLSFISFTSFFYFLYVFLLSISFTSFFVSLTSLFCKRSPGLSHSNQ
ncbi:FAD-binding domain-containing protein [Pyronema domesticum]|nr:FAD-binding domain-containing protein [Pyronema domesticum]